MSIFLEAPKLWICTMPAALLECRQGVFGHQKEKLHQWAERRRLELDAGRVEAVINAIGQLSSLPGYNQELCEREIGYFEKIRTDAICRVQKPGSFCWLRGAGSRCRTLIGQRLKQSVCTGPCRGPTVSWLYDATF